ncbi:hypothetical protein [Myroides profundi]|uniref:Lipoprotein n=1 Tax=Myroides profundi TaxID=480520 RepID=A0AAJ5BCQ6_MYRPR|nr:hypothetical protein [Myroides profundi]AJH14699.1 hypothetical protein MPR_1517 [Myroides profundi]SEQ18856.1 hypothetical protein SAMN04488089_10212 [Myroides profundi]
MKKFFTLAGISFIFLLTSCDDGNLVYKDIDFSKVTAVQRCTTPGADKIFYKLQKDEALILVIDADNIMRDETISRARVDINGTDTSLDYRKYTDKVEGKSICNLPPPATPSVIQSIAASPGGTVIIDRTVQVTNNTTAANNSVNLIYQYTFSLLNVNFNQGDTNIKYDNMPFGSTTYANRTLAFKFDNNNGNGLDNFNCNNSLYNLKDKEALILNITEGDLPTEPTTESIIELNEKRVVSLKQYSRTGINLNQVCEYQGDIPGSNTNNPNKLEEYWIASKGQIVIKSRWTEPADGSEPKLLHEISLRNLTFVKSSNSDRTFVKPALTFGTITTEKK